MFPINLYDQSEANGLFNKTPNNMNAIALEYRINFSFFAGKSKKQWFVYRLF
jgi:hypothetical protein